MTARLKELRVKIFADGADLASIVELVKQDHIRGFTTNPTLMRQAGIEDYEAFAHQLLELVSRHPISFEVFSDDFEEMERQALKITRWAENVYVKIPVTNTAGESSAKLVRRLTEQGVKVNVTALMTPAQVRNAGEWLEGGPHSFVSVFAGRIADSGRDPIPIMAAAVELLQPYPNVELIWASPREVLNVLQADAVGCHVITVTHDLLKKLPTLGRNLDEFSLDTVKMFHDDAKRAGFSL